MKEVFYEETATLKCVGSDKTKYYTLKIFSIVSFVLAAIWLLVVYNFYSFVGDVLINVLVVAVPFLIFIALGVVLIILKNNFCVDYDYTFVSGSVRISKIINNVKRKNVISFETQNIDKIGKYNSDTYKRYLSMTDVKTLMATSNETPDNNKEFYYLYVSVFAQKYLIVLECTEVFISYIIKFSSSLVIENGFFNK